MTSLWESLLSNRRVGLKNDLRVTGAVMAFLASFGMTGVSGSTVASFGLWDRSVKVTVLVKPLARFCLSFC